MLENTVPPVGVISAEEKRAVGVALSIFSIGLWAGFVLAATYHKNKAMADGILDSLLFIFVPYLALNPSVENSLCTFLTWFGLWVGGNVRG